MEGSDLATLLDLNAPSSLAVQIAKMGVPACCGSTAVTVLVRREGNVRKVYAANAGDARAVLCRLNSANGACGRSHQLY